MYKHELKYEEIINTAFREWSKSFFFNTSLSAVTDKLKMTKPAFYRYFKSKECLEDVMADRFLDDFFKVTFSIQDYKNYDFYGFLYEFFKKFIAFFAGNLHYTYFFSTNIRKDSFLRKIKFIQIILKQKRYFKYFIDNSKSFIPIEDLNFNIGYFYCSVFIILLKNKNVSGFSDEEIKNMTDLLFKISTEGFASKNDHKIDYLEIEKRSSLKDDEMLKRNRIFDAITSVVAKEGIWKASMKKIAEIADMSKSGFYFYFKSREDMLGNMFIDEITHMCKLVKKHQDEFGGFYEKLYCNIVVEASYFLKDERILYFFDWFHFQKVNLKYMKKNRKKLTGLLEAYCEYFKQAIDGKIIRDYSLDLDFISGFLNIQVVKELILKIYYRKESRIADMRRIYNLFLYGIKFYSNNDTV
jgi:AcrR family transcriptional regulator